MILDPSCIYYGAILVATKRKKVGYRIEFQFLWSYRYWTKKPNFTIGLREIVLDWLFLRLSIIKIYFIGPDNIILDYLNGEAITRVKPYARVEE